MQIGKKIKQLRTKKNMTIKNLSDITGLSVGFISNVERDINSPTISSIQKICQALDTNISDLFSIVESGSIVTRKEDRRRLVTAKDAKTIYEMFPLHNKKLRPSCIVVEPGADYGETPQGHDGDEICIVMKGSIEIQAGEDTYVLNEGDCIYIDANVPHRFRNIGNEQCVSFWVSQNN